MLHLFASVATGLWSELTPGLCNIVLWGNNSEAGRVWDLLVEYTEVEVKVTNKQTQVANKPKKNTTSDFMSVSTFYFLLLEHEVLLGNNKMDFFF